MRQVLMKWLLLVLVVALIPLGYRSYRVWRARQSVVELNAITAHTCCSPDGEEIAKLKALLDKDPGCTAARLALADSYDGIGDSVRAEQQYKLALKRSPNDPQVAFKLGEFYFIRKQSRKAIEAFEQCLQADSRYPEARERLARCHENLHDSKNALRAWRRVLAEDPKNDIAQRAIARVQLSAHK